MIQRDKSRKSLLYLRIMYYATSESMSERGERPFLAVLSKLKREHPKQLATLIDTKFLRHVATYLIDRSTNGVVLWERKTKKMKYPEWRAFGGCDKERSLIEAMNCLRLELMDESGIVATSSNYDFSYSPLCILDNVLLQVRVVDGIDLADLWSPEAARTCTFIDHDADVVSVEDRIEYGVYILCPLLCLESVERRPSFLGVEEKKTHPFSKQACVL